jgi:D-3-phosphoglycerate dehydrogenase
MNRDKQIYIIDPVHQSCITTLKEAGLQVKYLPEVNPEILFQDALYIYGIIVRSKIKFDEITLQKFPFLQFIGRVGAGMENIDTNAANKLGISCFNSPEGNRDAVGEHCIGMLLCLFNKLRRSGNEIQNRIWDRNGNRGEEIKGKTIGIIGFGNTGSAFARKLRGFECRILAYDKFKKDFGNEWVEEVNLKEILNFADIISLHIPLNVTTEYLVNEQFIDSVKKSFYLINTSRGKNVNTKAVVQRLKTGKLIGACLDVIEYEDFGFENAKDFFENPNFQYLSHADNVILSPHVAGWTHQSNQRMAEVIAAKVLSWHKIQKICKSNEISNL